MYDRDALLAAVDLPALADELLGPRPRGRGGWMCPNPQHPQTGRTPPLSVFTTRLGAQRWRCHGCGEGGSAIDLVMATQGVDARRAMEMLASETGQRPQAADWKPPPHPKRPPPPPRPDLAVLGAYVDECARALWTPEGAEARRYLTRERGLPSELLRRNRVGADRGKYKQPRPEGVPAMSGVVLPVLVDERVVYSQIRVIKPWPGPKYLNTADSLALNPRVSVIEPLERRHREVIITEGSIDGFSAAAAGYLSAAVLGGDYPDAAVAHALARLPGPLVLAFDPDALGETGGSRLQRLLAAKGRPCPKLHLVRGDLNEAFIRCGPDAWPSRLERRIEAARSAGRAPVDQLRR